MNVFFYMATSIVSQGNLSENLHNVHHSSFWKFGNDQNTVKQFSTADPRFLWRVGGGGGQLQKWRLKTIIWLEFCHENERNWTLGRP